MNVPQRCASIASALLLAACLTYTPQELSGRSAVDLCEMQTEYRVNLSEESRRRLAAELERRKIDCRDQRAAIKMKRDAQMYEWTYLNQSP